MKKHPIQFIHASDLHLDAVFPGLSKEVPLDIAIQLHEATFTALQNLVTLCIEKKPNFLLLAGDIYNEEDHSLRASLALRNACIALENEGIPVFIIHGNHDPYSSRFQSLTWPKNTTIFETTIENKPVTLADGTLIARIYGISHSTNKEHMNLAKHFQPTEDPCLHIGLLHCTIGETATADRYAPCSLKDLTSAGMDYWALGHVHEYQTLSQEPLIIYPGCTQGLRINEQGPKGCVLITAEPQGNGYTFNSIFYPLGPVIWHTLDIPLKDTLSPTEEAISKEILFDYIKNQIFNDLHILSKSLHSNYKSLILRVTLSGKTTFDTYLKNQNNITELVTNLRAQLAEEHALCWLKDIIPLTTPTIDSKKFLERDDLLGEIFRLSSTIKSTDEELNDFCQKTLMPLYSNKKLQKILNYPSKEECKQLLLEAEYLCAELLEKK